MTPLTDSEIKGAIDVKFASGAPLDERREAGEQYVQHYSDKSLSRQMLETLPRGVGGAIEWEKAINREIQRSKSGRLSLSANPYSAAEYSGFRSKSFMTPESTLRVQAARNPQISAVLARFRNRMLGYASPVSAHHTATLANQRGWRVILKNAPPTQRLSDDDRAEQQRITDFIRYSGDAPRWNPGGKNYKDFDRDPFDSVLAKIVHDRFEIDRVSFEMNWTYSRRRLSGTWVVDSGTVWNTLRPGEAGANLDYAKFHHGQIVNGRVERLFTSNDLAVYVNNPRSSLHLGGYGISETESCGILTVGIMNVLTMTNANFDRNALPEGILVLHGLINDEAMGLFRDEQMAYRADPGGGFGYGLLNMRDPASKAQWLQTGKPYSDMGHQSYVSLLNALTASQFGEDVMALNGSPHGGQSGGLNSGKDTKARQDDARGIGFNPWMAKAERILNEVYALVLGDKWQFSWIGLEQIETSWMQDLFKEVATVDQGRALLGMEDEGGVVGSSLIHNPAISQQTAVMITAGINPGGTLGKVFDEANKNVAKPKERPAKLIPDSGA